jgi:glutamate-1-semialdehyde 2,1-aminomutase
MKNLISDSVDEDTVSSMRSTATDNRVCEQLLDRAKNSIAGGDSSSMRTLPYAIPLIAESGQGARLRDAGGREYIDLNMAYGPLIFGHRPPEVINRVVQQLLEHGSQFGFQSELGIRVAEKLKRLFPSMELMRFANSGTEACASAIRLARSFTGRSKIIIFEGGYHGWSEAVFNRYHAPLEQLTYEDFGPAIPGTSGMMGGGPVDLIVVRYNNLEALHRCLEAHAGTVAGILLEPIQGNAGVLPPAEGFLQGLKEAAHAHNALLMFDEVITGLRVAPGGAQEYYGVRPDITIVSKALGSGVPIGAFGVSREIMDVIVKGQMFHGGVFSANALVMSAADAVLDKVLTEGPQIYGHLREVSQVLADGLRRIFSDLGIPHIVQHVGPMLSLFLTDGEVDECHEYRDVRKHCRFDTFIELQHHLQNAGVFFHPNQFEPMFLSTAHTLEDISMVLAAMEEGARKL